MFIHGVCDQEVQGAEGFFEYYKIGDANRVTALTKMNAASSRSHVCLIISVQKRTRVKLQDIQGSSNSTMQRKLLRGKLFLVDLAGSERLKKTGATGTRRDEAKYINMSLTNLGLVINALECGKTHIPFRDSKLTRLLQDSLGGHGKTSIIITIGPSSTHLQETISSLQFGLRAMKVKTKAKIFETIDYKALSARLKAQIEELEIKQDETDRELLELMDENDLLTEKLLTKESELQETNIRITNILSDSESEKSLLLVMLEENMQKTEESYSEKIRELQKAMEILKEKSEKEREALEREYQSQLSAMKSELENKSDDINQLQDELDYVKSDIVQRESELEILLDKNSQYEQDMDILLSKLHATERELDDEIASAKETIDMRDREIEDMQMSMREMEQKWQVECENKDALIVENQLGHEREMGHIRTQYEHILQKLREEHLAAMTKMQEEQEMVLEQLKNDHIVEMTDIHDKHSEIERQLSYRKDQEMESLKEKVIAESTERESVFRLELEKVKEEQDRLLEVQQAQNDDLKKRLKDAEDNMKRLTRENEELLYTQQQTDEMKKSMQDEIRTLETTIQSLRQDVTEQQKVVQYHGISLQQELDEAKKNLHLERQNSSQLQQQLTKTQQSMLRMEKEMERIMQMPDPLQSQPTMLDTSAYEEEKATNKRAMIQVSMDKKKEGHGKELQAQNDSLEKENETVLRDMDSLKEKLEEKINKQNELQEAIEKERQKLENESKKLAAQQSALEQIEQQISKKIQVPAVDEEKVDNTFALLQQSIKRSEQERSKLQKRLEKLRNRNTTNERKMKMVKRIMSKRSTHPQTHATVQIHQEISQETRPSESTDSKSENEEFGHPYTQEDNDKMIPRDVLQEENQDEEDLLGYISEDESDEDEDIYSPKSEVSIEENEVGSSMNNETDEANGTVLDDGDDYSPSISTIESITTRLSDTVTMLQERIVTLEDELKEISGKYQDAIGIIAQRNASLETRDCTITALTEEISGLKDCIIKLHKTLVNIEENVDELTTKEVQAVGCKLMNLFSNAHEDTSEKSSLAFFRAMKEVEEQLIVRTDDHLNEDESEELQDWITVVEELFSSEPEESGIEMLVERINPESTTLDILTGSKPYAQDRIIRSKEILSGQEDNHIRTVNALFSERISSIIAQPISEYMFEEQHITEQDVIRSFHQGDDNESMTLFSRLVESDREQDRVITETLDCMAIETLASIIVQGDNSSNDKSSLRSVLQSLEFQRNEFQVWILLASFVLRMQSAMVQSSQQRFRHVSRIALYCFMHSMQLRSEVRCLHHAIKSISEEYHEFKNSTLDHGQRDLAARVIQRTFRNVKARRIMKSNFRVQLQLQRENELHQQQIQQLSKTNLEVQKVLNENTSKTGMMLIRRSTIEIEHIFKSWINYFTREEIPGSGPSSSSSSGSSGVVGSPKSTHQPISPSARQTTPPHHAGRGKRATTVSRSGNLGHLRDTKIEFGGDSSSGIFGSRTGNRFFGVIDSSVMDANFDGNTSTDTSTSGSTISSARTPQQSRRSGAGLGDNR